MGSCTWLLVVLAALLGLVGCAQGDDARGGASGGTDSAETRSTTVPGADDATADGHPDPDRLTDGTHQVSVRSVDGDSHRLTLDGVQVLEGTEAVLAYLADTHGNQLEGPQVYVRNHREKLQDLQVDPDGEFAVIFGPQCCEPQDLGWHGFAELANSGFADVWGKDPPFEVTITNGTVTSLIQTYVP